MSRFSCRLYGVNSKSPHEAPADAERGLRIRRLARSGASRTDASGVRIRYDAPAHIAHAALRQYPCPPPYPFAIRHPPSAIRIRIRIRIRSCTLLTSTPPDNRDICLSKACMSISAQSATVRMRTRRPEALFRDCRLQPCTMYRAPNMQHRRSRAQALTGMPGNHSIRTAKNAEQSSRHRHIG